MIINIYSFCCSYILISTYYLARPASSQLFNSHFRVIRPCPPPYDSMYCLNGGKCFAEIGPRSISPFCRCARHYHGQRCEYLFDSDIYGFSKVSNRVENKAISTVAVVLFLMVVVFAWCLILHRRLIMTATSRAQDSMTDV